MTHWWLYAFATTSFALFLVRKHIVQLLDLYLARAASRTQLKAIATTNSTTESHYTRDYVSPASLSSSSPAQIALSPLDILNSCPLSLLYIFPGRLDADRLRDGLQKALTIYPQLGGNIHFNNRSAWIDCSHPRVSFEVSRNANPQEMAPAISHGLASSAYIRQLPLGYPMATGECFTVRVTHFKDKSVLGLCFQHILGDAHTLFRMLHCWQLAERCIDLQNPACNANLVSSNARSLFLTPTLSSRPPHNPGYIECSFVSRVWRIIKRLKGLGKCSYESLHLSAAKMQQLSASMPPTAALSANDIICAYLWKQLAASTKGPDEEAFPLVFVVDLRGIVSSGVPDTFAGNAGVFVKLAATRGQVRAAPLASLAQQIRDNVQSLRSTAQHRDAIEFLAAHYRQDGPFAFLSLANPIDFRGLFVSNWSREPLLDAVSFGAQRPERVVFPSAPLPYLSLVLPSNDNAFDVVISGPEDEMATLRSRVQSPDLASA